MDTARLKRFAVEARNKIKHGVMLMIRQWGLDAEGNVIEEPQLLQGGTLFRNNVIGSEDVYYRWCALRDKIQQVGLRNIYEEVSYTWFNRFIAIKILSKNKLLESYLDYETDGNTTVIISQARRGVLPEMSDYNRKRVIELIDEHNRDAELLTLLISSVCHNTPILANCFGRINDYTELLLPRTIITHGDFLDMLNDENYITDDDYRQPELIGWLYQFYISERKDEVFASFKDGKKATKDEIPAATQIFTPNWIVKYMVQNTVGRIYLDNNPYSNLKENWKYLVETSEENTSDENVLKIENPEELTIIDAGCGSGHILVEAFDTLYKIYIEQYASPREACDLILKYNIVGVDIDTRAKQLAQFALLMQACNYVPEMADCHVMPRIYDMPEPISKEEMENLRDTLPHFFLGSNEKVIKETTEAIELLQQAQELGSIMKFNISEATRYAIKKAMEYENAYKFSFYPHLKLMLALTEKYASVVMNPPYMGASHMECVLLNYVKDIYPLTANDLGAVFMDVAFNHLKVNGKMGIINQAAWLLKPAYKEYRASIINNNDYWLENTLYLGPGTFPELKGEVVQSVAFVSSHSKRRDSLFFHLKRGESSEKKRELYLNRDCPQFNISIKSFLQFAGLQFGFWINKDVQKTFKDSPIQKYGDAKQGLKTGDNTYFIRLWFEVPLTKLNHKWFPVETGGSFRKWYGNGISVLNWENDGYEIKNFKNEQGKLRSRPQGLQFSFKKGITWSTSAGEKPSFRISGDEYLFESSGSKFFIENENQSLSSFCAYFNSFVVRSFISMLSPGLGISEGAIKSLPFIMPSENCEFLSDYNIKVSKHDWDAHETSWDFKCNELLSIDEETYFQNIKWQVEKHYKATGETIYVDPAAPEFDSLQWCYEQYKEKWERLFTKLHENEEELNRQFIDIYGLQDELTPEVPLDEITILQQGEIKIEDNEIKWNSDVVMKHFISYAIGVWMGRYRLDKPGLHIAHPAPTEEEVSEYEYKNQIIEIDDDGIIPILPEDSPFTDNAHSRVVKFISTVFGTEKQIENLNFLESSLGKSVSDYLMKDFWKDHKKMYQNRPIYWLFRSKKGAFQCITYMHRMDEYTLERIRQKYLLPYISFLDDKISAMQSRDTLSTAETRQITKLKTILAECREYHDILHQYSQKNISFDLDDGVVKNYALFGNVVAKLK